MGRASGSWPVRARGPQVGKPLRDSGRCLNIGGGKRGDAEGFYKGYM